MHNINGDRRAIIEEKKLKVMNKKLSFYQRFKMGLERNLNIDPGRLLGLTDGIFGMVMTLLVFGIAIPELQITTYSDFITFMVKYIFPNLHFIYSIFDFSDWTLFAFLLI